MNKRRLLGELIVATGADALDIEVLAGGLLAMVESSDPAQKESWRKHGVTFEAAREAFDDPEGIDELDDQPDEERWTLTALTSRGLLYVADTQRGSRIRIISAREADRHEQDRYQR